MKESNDTGTGYFILKLDTTAYQRGIALVCRSIAELPLQILLFLFTPGAK